MSRGNLAWVSLALAVVALHATIHHWIPGFTPPASPDKTPWVRVGLYGELIFHVAVLGAVSTSIGNRVPWWKQPSYSDEGTLSIDSTAILPQPETRWAEIGFIFLEFAIYLALWAWIYQII